MPFVIGNRVFQTQVRLTAQLRGDPIPVIERYKCPHCKSTTHKMCCKGCGNILKPSRRDSKYCTNRCAIETAAAKQRQ